VYTNEDLEKLGVPAQASPQDISKEEAAMGRATAERQALDKASRDAAAKLRAEAERRIEDLNAELDRLSQREASVRNPLLPRAALTEEEQREEEGLAGPARLKLIEARKKELQQKIDDERKFIDSITPR